MSADSRWFEVDGESFRLTFDDRQVNVTWSSGPNQGYGFASARSSGAWTDDELITAIRGLLANINPATGYLD